MPSKIRNLVEKMEAVLEDRTASYGSGGIFAKIALCWSAITGTHISAPQVALMMAVFKILREQSAPKSDNIEDLLGYIEWYLRLQDQGD